MRRGALAIIVILFIIATAYLAVIITTPNDSQSNLGYSDEPPGYRYNGLIFTLEINMTTNASEIQRFYQNQGFANISFAPQHSYYDDRDATIGVVEEYPPYAQASIVMLHSQWTDTDDLDNFINESITVSKMIIGLENNRAFPFRYYSNYSNAYDNYSDVPGVNLYKEDLFNFDEAFDEFWADFYNHFEVEYFEQDFESWIIYEDT